LDIRYPIGGLFVALGLILAIYGIWSDPAIYQRSLGININLWWGLVLSAGGMVSLLLAGRDRKRP
jgi:hypothetical protein